MPAVALPHAISWKSWYRVGLREARTLALGFQKRNDEVSQSSLPKRLGVP